VAIEAKGFMPDDEGMALHRVGLEAASRRLGPLLEIGTYCGKSAVYLGSAARAEEGLLYSVDHHRGSEELQPGWADHDPELVDPRSGRMDSLAWARRTIEAADLERSVVLVVGDSPLVAKHWSTPLSLVFIDGGHGAEVAWQDYRSWTPKLAIGGLLAIHDVFPDPADGGRPPYELYCAALASGAFEEDGQAARGSLRILERVPGPLEAALGSHDDV
jgi:hypothetical protein